MQMKKLVIATSELPSPPLDERRVARFASPLGLSRPGGNGCWPRTPVRRSSPPPPPAWPEWHASRRRNAIETVARPRRSPMVGNAGPGHVNRPILVEGFACRKRLAARREAAMMWRSHGFWGYGAGWEGWVMFAFMIVFVAAIVVAVVFPSGTSARRWGRCRRAAARRSLPRTSSSDATPPGRLTARNTCRSSATFRRSGGHFCHSPAACECESRRCNRGRQE